MGLFASCGEADSSGTGDTAGSIGDDSGEGGPDSDSDPPAGSSSASGDASDSDSADVTTDATGDGEDSADSSGTGEPLVCPPPAACDAQLPNPGPEVEWNDGQSSIVSNSGAPMHRGRDMFYNPGDPQWVLAKFAYGLNDWDLEGERIDMFLLRDCGDTWEPLGTITTTYEDEHAAIEGVDDTGGRVYFQIPESIELLPGRHRVRLFVRGDASGTDVYLHIVDPGTPIFVADIDGTLTTAEAEEFTALLGGVLPEINPSAPEALWALVDRGYLPMYLTARPEFLGARTREFVHERGLPPGVIHTTLSYTGALGSAAVEYKTGELAALASRGLLPHWVFGNTDSDAEAYELAGIAPVDQRVFFQFDDVHGGRRIDDYATLVPEFDALPAVCE